METAPFSTHVLPLVILFIVVLFIVVIPLLAGLMFHSSTKDPAKPGTPGGRCRRSIADIVAAIHSMEGAQRSEALDDFCMPLHGTLSAHDVAFILGRNAVGDPLDSEVPASGLSEEEAGLVFRVAMRNFRRIFPSLHSDDRRQTLITITSALRRLFPDAEIQRRLNQAIS